MDSDYLKPYVGKITVSHPEWSNWQWGSGIIFRAKKDFQNIYLLTARHNFLEHNRYDTPLYTTKNLTD